MFGIGTEELLLILVIALVVLGPERMPKLARDLGRMVADFRRTSDELRTEFLNADSIIDVAARSAAAPAVAPAPPPEIAATAAEPPSSTEVTSATSGAAPDGGVLLNAGALLGSGALEPLTEPAVATGPSVGAADGAPEAPAAQTESDETSFDREAREAHERLKDPARARQAAAEGWKTPTDEAGTTDRWG